MITSKYLNNREYKERYDDSMEKYQPQYEIVKNGFILPTSVELLTKGGVVDNNYKYVEYSGNRCEAPFINISAPYEFSTFSTEYKDEDVIFLGYYLIHWGHMLWDCVSKFWILNLTEFSKYKVVFLPYRDGELNGNFLRFLQLSGVDYSRLIFCDYPSQFRTIIVPESAHDSDRWLHSRVYKKIFDTVVCNVKYNEIKVPSKVYFSRESFGKPEWGENEISRNFERNGFTIIYPEKITLDEQIAILQFADVVASENSSICLNCVFAREGLKWIVINKYSAVHENFSEFRYMSKIEPIYIDAYSRFLNFYGETIGTRPYLVSFNRNMKKYFDDNNMKWIKTPIQERLKNIYCYVKACLKEYFTRLFSNTLTKIVNIVKQFDGLYKMLKYIERLVIRVEK